MFEQKCFIVSKLGRLGRLGRLQTFPEVSHLSGITPLVPSSMEVPAEASTNDADEFIKRSSKG